MLSRGMSITVKGLYCFLFISTLSFGLGYNIDEDLGTNLYNIRGGFSPHPSDAVMVAIQTPYSTWFCTAVIISPDCVVTAKHWIGAYGSSYPIGKKLKRWGGDPNLTGDEYIVVDKRDANADFMICRVKKTDPLDPDPDPSEYDLLEDADFTEWVELYPGNQEVGQVVTFGSYGRIERNEDTWCSDQTYQALLAPGTLHWGRNIITIASGSYIAYNYDNIDMGDYIPCESYGTYGNSGSPWFIQDECGTWYYVGLFTSCESGPRTSYHKDNLIALIADMECEVPAVRKVTNITSGCWYHTIQDAIDSASNGDEIVVYPGTYEECINFSGKAITIRGTQPDDWDVVAATIIDAAGAMYTVGFLDDEGTDSVLMGITITGSGYLGGVLTEDASPTIRRCIIRDNTNRGIFTNLSGSALIENNKIFDNGNGIWNEYTSPVIINNWIYTNNSGIAYAGSGVTGTVVNNTIVYNNNGGVICRQTSAQNIENCILWANGDDLYNCSAVYSCIEDGDAGTGNISEDPCFVDPNNNDYHLDPNSPCINAGNLNGNYSGQADIDDEDRVQYNRVDIGADESGYNVFRPAVLNANTNYYYYTIQSAVNAAVNGDELVVYPSTYYESVTIGYNKSIVLRSTNPDDWDVVAVTVIDGNGATNVVQMGSGAANPTLKGLTVTGGIRGVYCMGTSNGDVNHCIVTGNSDTGILVNSANAYITNCIIQNNGSKGIAVSSASSTIKNSLIDNNGIGVSVELYATGNIYNCTIVGNNSYGVSRILPYSSSTIRNCILWDNGDDLYNCTATYSCIENGDAGTGNISSDPCFVDAGSHDYHLLVSSPCIETGDPSGSYTGQYDIDGQPRVIGYNVDMGTDEYNSL